MGGVGGAKSHSFISFQHSRLPKLGCPHRPEVVHDNIEYAENHHQHNRAPLRLEAHRDHHACHGTDGDHDYTAESPLACEYEANKQEDEQDSAGELEVHLAVLLVKLWETGRRKLLAYPAVGEHHDQAAHNRKVAQEKVDVEDESIAQCLCDYNSDETADRIFTVLADDDENTAASHGEHVDEEEDVVDTPRH